MKTKQSELNNVIPPEIKNDKFYYAIQKMAQEENIKNVLEIGSSAGTGSTEAFLSGLQKNPKKPSLFCIEISKPRFAELQKRYAASPFVKCYNVSSVSLHKFPPEDEVAQFYNSTKTALNNYPLSQVLGWLQQDIEYLKGSGVAEDGIQKIKRENKIDNFDMVLIDGCEFTGRAELDEVYGSKIILLDDIDSFKNYHNYKRLVNDSSYSLVTENRKLRNGYAVFKRNSKVLPIHFFTIVLNGEPFIRYHIDILQQLPFKWHWHIIEGVADLKHDTAWSLQFGGHITDELHQNGLSNDGTTEYLNELAKQFPENITIYRKPAGVFWNGKLEMVNAPLANITENCLLWQVDADELWIAGQICTMRDLFEQKPDKTAAYFHCHFFVGPNMVTITPEAYSHHKDYEWLRVWRFRPQMRWASHEPPRLAQLKDRAWTDIARINPFIHEEMMAAGLVFTHYAYALESQVSFKEKYYGYKGAVERWKLLQQAKDFPVFLRDYLWWVTDDAQADRIENRRIGAQVEPITWNFAEPMKDWNFNTARSRRVVVIDGVIFQLQAKRFLGISRVWQSLIPELVKLLPDHEIIILKRKGFPTGIYGVQEYEIPACRLGPDSLLDTDDALLTSVCNDLSANIFLSTYYSRALGIHNVLLIHDMIPEILGFDLSRPEWRSKIRAIENAESFIAVSKSTRNDLLRICREVSPEKVIVAHNGVSSEFCPASKGEIEQFFRAHNIKSPYFILVGNRTGYKNCDSFLHAFANLKGREKQRILAVGGEPYFLPQETQFAKELNIQFIPWLSENELKAAYSGATSLVYLSRYEGFGLPVLEAMACGCPVITTRSASLPEVGGNAVLYVKPDSQKEITEALHEVLNTDVRTRLHELGIEQARKFTWHNMAQNCVKLIGDDKTLNIQENNLNKQGEILYAKGNIEDELDAYTKALNIDSSNAVVHNNLGVLYCKQGDKEKALKYYRQALQLQPENTTFRKNLADFYYVELGQVEDALEHYAKALSNNPADLNTLLMLGHISVSKKRFDEATSFYNKVLKIEPGNKDAREFLERLEKCRLSVAGGQADQVNNEADSNGYLVSAIVSTYNAERFIRGCLENLENQTISDRLEIIVVNSGSQQNEETVVKEFQEKYSNIKYLKTDQRETVYTAWNRGIKAATGKYITNANTDDRHRQDALEKLVDILEKRPDMVLSYGDCFVTRVENQQFEKFTPAGRYEWPDFSRNSLLNACVIGPQPVWRRSLHNEFGYFDENYRCGADYEFWLRISQRYNFIHIREYLGLYFANENTISMKGDLPKNEMEEIKETYRKRYDRIPVLKSGEESIYRILHELNMDKTEVNVLANSGISDTLLEDILKLPSVMVYKKGQRSSVNTWDAILISADEVEELDVVELMSNIDFRYIGISDTAYRLSDKKCTDLLNGLSELGCHNLFGDCSVFEWSERATFGWILFEQGKLHEAARYLHRLLNADPTDVNGLNTMGLIAFEQKSFDIAEEFTLKALELDRRNVNTLINLTEICWAKGQYKKARELAKQAIEIDGTQQHVLERIIGIQWDEGPVSLEIGYSRHLSPKNILVINNLYPPQELGGYGRLLCDFANILEKRGHTIQVLTSDTPYLGQIEKDESNIDRGLHLYGGWQDGVCRQIDDNDRVIQTIKTNLEKVRSIVREFRPELCLLGNIDFLSHIVLTPFMEMSIPVIHHLGNKLPGYSLNDTPQSNLYRLATASRWLRDQIMRQGYPVKEISVVYPGALVKEFRMHVSPALDKLRIAYAGIVLPYKGPHILIKALKMLHDRGVDFCCALAGTTTDVGFVNQLKRYVVASGMGDKIDFLGFLPRAKLKAFFARNNVLVFPSIVQEAFGISQVEAMAAGLTVLSSGTGGAKEIIEHGQSGLIFESNNSESLAQELLGLMENPEKWRAMAEGGRKRAIEEFDIERSVDILEQEFLKLISGQRSTGSEYKQAKIGGETIGNYTRLENQEHGVSGKSPEGLYE